MRRSTWALSIPSALRITEKKFPLILVRGSQSYLSWFIVSLVHGRKECIPNDDYVFGISVGWDTSSGPKIILDRRHGMACMSNF